MKQKNIFGRYFITETFQGNSVVVEDNSQKTGDYWLPVTGSNGIPIGHIHFKKVAQGVFELDQLRPAFCPNQDLQGDCIQSLCHQQEAI